MLNTKNKKLCISTANTHQSKISKYHPHCINHETHEENSPEKLSEQNPDKTDEFVYKM